VQLRAQLQDQQQVSNSMKETPPKTNPERPSAFTARRQFIQVGLAAVGAAWAGVLVQSRLFPIQSATAEVKPVQFPLSELPVGSAKTINYGGSPAIVLRTPESLKAFSLVCTHLGCLVEWQEGEKIFYCPCHDGRFDQFGEVVSGPPPLPLETYPVSIVAEQVVVGEEL
jgi:cytochrome b6-f complex iron-sulfur subunit